MGAGGIIRFAFPVVFAIPAGDSSVVGAGDGNGLLDWLGWF